MVLGSERGSQGNEKGRLPGNMSTEVDPVSQTLLI